MMTDRRKQGRREGNIKTEGRRKDKRKKKSMRGTNKNKGWPEMERKDEGKKMRRRVNVSVRTEEEERRGRV